MDNACTNATAKIAAEGGDPSEVKNMIKTYRVRAHRAGFKKIFNACSYTLKHWPY